MATEPTKLRRVGVGSAVGLSMLLAFAFGPPHLSARALSTSSDPVIAAAGDIACRKPAPNLDRNRCFAQLTSDLILSHPEVDRVLTLGDSQYPCGSFEQFTSGYDPTWGRMLSYTQPAVGNHEYEVHARGCDTQATGYFRYFGAAALGPIAGPANGQDGYYYFDVAGQAPSTSQWRIIVLNANCGIVPCAKGSPQELFLQNAIDTAPVGAHIIAAWHQPYFAGSGLPPAHPSARPFWSDLYQAHAALVLNGHAHYFERYAPQDPSGNATEGGLTEMIVGTGGASHGSLKVISPNTAAWDNVDYGALFLTLHDSSFDWQFIATDGTVIDSGTQPLA